MDLNREIPGSKKFSSVFFSFIALVVIGYNGFNYYESYQKNQFVEKYNKNAKIMQEVLLNFTNSGLKIVQEQNEDGKISISDVDFEKGKLSINDVIDNGCDKLSKMDNECKDIYWKSLEIITKMNQGILVNNNDEADNFTKKMNDFKAEFNNFQLNLMIKEGLNNN